MKTITEPISKEWPELWNPKVIYCVHNLSSDKLIQSDFPILLLQALLEEPPILQLLKNFPAFYGSRRFTRALHWSLS
jgi:hypothetical protein